MSIGPTIENLRKKRAEEAALLEMLYALPTPTGGFDVNTPAERRQLAEIGLRGGEPYSDGRMDYGRQRPVQETIDVMPQQPAEFYVREVSRDLFGERTTNDLFGYPQGTGNLVGDILTSGGMLGAIGATAPLTAWDAGAAAARGDYGDAALKSAFSLLEGAGLGELATGARGLRAVANEFPEAAQEVGQKVRGFLADESGSLPLLSAMIREGGTGGVSAPAKSGLRAFHGSPHDFDYFRMSEIGTGEGAQAYGHGLYFAENEGVARGYRDALTDGPTKVDISGEYFSPDELDGIEADAARAVLQYETPSGWRQYLSRYYDDDQVDEAMALLESGEIKAAPAGRMYEVDINANPEDFLDWDKPLSEQPKKVQEAFSTLGAPERLASVQGEDAYHALSNNLGAAPNASEALREAGIFGIRYLDAGSRGAGEGTRNYVIFDENLINIVRKYGVAGAAAMLGVSALDVEQAMAQGQQQPQGLLSTGVQ